MNLKRRQLLLGVSAIGAGTVLASCAMPQNSSTGARNDEPRKEGDESDEAAGIEVTATEDLMREHGILRRILLVFSETATKLKQDAGSVPTDELEKAAQLFRVFGEDYHEKKLEEAYIFPSVRQAQGQASSYVDVLMSQHVRGREITDYILSVTKGDKIPAAGVEEFIKALESMVRMYEHHAAIEDTIIFPAWKAAIGDRRLDELGAKFEEIETESFGGDGFETVQKRISEIEQNLGLSNLDMFTAPPLQSRKT
ncbi:MAG TPA: hemerythrin domain-containing protein [Pyrinomonadaceae bacterium]|nr:hemerythrin domain-containing protein [Pyrinomonadaceae bacterium]